MGKSIEDIKTDLLKIISDYFESVVKPSYTESRILDETTESDFSTATEFSTESSTLSYLEEGLSIYKNYNSTVFSEYSSKVLWFGGICCMLFAILGTTGNLISILALVRCKRLRNATTAFIVNLCVADMLYCCFTMPLNGLAFIDRDWNYGDALCKLFGLVKFSNGIVSIFTVVAITINRYVLIVHPNVYRWAYNTRNTGISIACLWLLPMLILFLPLFNVWGTLSYNPRVGDCGVNNLHGKSPRGLIFVIIIVVPSILFVACYSRIYCVVKKSVGTMHKQSDVAMPEYRRNPAGNGESQRGIRSSTRVELRDKKEFRVLRIVLVIFIFYMLSIFPISLIKLFRKERDLQVLNIFAYVFYFSANVINPIIYVAMSREYRQAYKELFTSNICWN